jgi:hypothetical protein
VVYANGIVRWLSSLNYQAEIVMPRFPKPWSKKRGKRNLGNSLAGEAGEVAFYAAVFLVGVFGLSLVLINEVAPESVAQVPTDALRTGLSTWVIGVLSLAALVTGGASLLYRLARIGASSERRSAIAKMAGSIEMLGPSADDGKPLPSVPKGSAITESPGERLTYRLAAEKTKASIAGPATLALLWSSVWFVLLAVVVSGFWYGRPRWYLAMLLVPFAVIGVWSFRFFMTQFRQHAGVGPTIVEISNHPLFPGRQYRLFVSQTGRLKLKRLTVQLTCEEETFYRQGTDVRVDRHEAIRQVIFKERNVAVDPQAPWEQQLQLDLPENVMHSFVGTHNAIRWKIVVIGESQPWPSFCRSFPVVVHPPGLPLKRNPR